MPLFREHRGALDDSLDTTIIVKTEEQLLAHIVKVWPEMVSISCLPYPTEEQCFDPRTGWYTQIVTVSPKDSKENFVVGFLSEPFLELKNV